MSARRRFFPFNAEQTINILSEFGPLVTMFVVNAMYGIDAGTWALIGTTAIAIGTMFYVFGRPPVFPLIASTVTVVFGALTLITGDPMWVQIKVTIFNAMFAGVLFGGLYGHESKGHHRSMWAVVALSVIGLAMPIGYLASKGKLHEIADIFNSAGVGATIQRLPQSILVAALVIGFLIGAMLLKRNFFQYVFEKTFRYTEEGWDQFTWSFAWFFVFTAIANELVRWAFPPPPTEVALACTKQALEHVNSCVQQAAAGAKSAIAACKNQLGVKKAQCLEPYAYNLLGHKMDGVNVWILFKIALIMPLSGLYAWLLTRFMHKHRLPDDHDGTTGAPQGERGPHAGGPYTGAQYAALHGEQPAAVAVPVRRPPPSGSGH